jgi:hypothetical protein
MNSSSCIRIPLTGCVLFFLPAIRSVATADTAEDDAAKVAQNPIASVTVNWSAPGSQQWTVPVGGGLGKIVHWDRLRVNLQLAARRERLCANAEPGPQGHGRDP